jgi:hypothetical protein
MNTILLTILTPILPKEILISPLLLSGKNTHTHTHVNLFIFIPRSHLESFRKLSSYYHHKSTGGLQEYLKNSFPSSLLGGPAKDKGATKFL